MILALAVACGGGLGAVARYLTDGAIGDRVGGPFPAGTFAINTVGSLVLGVLTGLAWYHGLGASAKTVLGTGFCGGLTTWSTASWESVRLAELRQWRPAIWFTLGGLAAALAAATAGIALCAAL